jgi:hypothetical protein
VSEFLGTLVTPAMNQITLVPVDPGTEINDFGHTLVVRKGSAVRKGRTVYLTHDEYEQLKADPRVELRP